MNADTRGRKTKNKLALYAKTNQERITAIWNAWGFFLTNCDKKENYPTERSLGIFSYKRFWLTNIARVNIERESEFVLHVTIIAEILTALSRSLI